MPTRKRASRGGRVTARFTPSVVKDRAMVEARVGLRLHDPAPSIDRPGEGLGDRPDRLAAAKADAIVVPCCGNSAEFARLAATGIPLVRYDVRNRGGSTRISDPARLGFAREVADLEAVCTMLGLRRVSIMAWSYHTAVAARFALDHPDRVERMVLAAAIPCHSGAQGGKAREPSPDQLARLDQLQAEGVPTRDPERWCAAWREVYLPLRMARPEAFARLAPVCHLANERPDHVARSVITVLTDLHPFDWRADLRELVAPVLVVHGSADTDPVDHAAEWVQVVPDGRLLELAGVGTLPWVEEPDRFFDVANRFLMGESV